MKTPLFLLLLLASSAHAARPYRNGAVATAHPLASEAAVEVLRKGGNAADAAVAAAFVMGVVGPFHSGIGGGGFALVHDGKSGETEVADFREVAPAAATRDMFVKDGKVVPGLSTDGALSVAVPGAAQGYLALQKKYGKLKPAQELEPAIRAAGKGFWVGPQFRAHATDRLECLKKDPEATKLFLRAGPDKQPAAPAVGTLLKQPDLAETLRALASQGEKAFQQGKIPEAIAATVKSFGGVLTAADLAAYQVRWRKPLETHYRGHRILTMPPPSAGGLAVVQVLAALEQGGTQGLPSRDPEVIHRYVEAVRRAYVDRARYLGDPAFNPIDLPKLSSREYVEKELMASFDAKKATASKSLLAVPGNEPVGKKNTTHLSVIDSAGNAVSMTTTVNYSFGSCIVAKGTGVLLNDEMDDFAAQPMTPNAYGLITGEANAVAPGKIPLSSMSPTLVFAREDPKRVMLAVGSPGGSTIPTTVIQVISNIIDGPMDVVRAVGNGRIHHQYMPDAILVDRFGLEPATARALEAKGHTLNRTEGWGDAEAVYRDPVNGLFSAGSDPRNEGSAAGID
jgi:gamma-glutamyltranspeptidase/glutathione hydrolase